MGLEVLMRVSRVLWCATFLVAWLGAPRPARADATAFLGVAGNPAARSARGFSVGVSVIIVGFEFEYMHASEDALASAPALTTGMGNVFVQTPTRFQLYATTGAGVFRERLGGTQETNVGFNSGAGAKVPLAGPIRVRFDYRVFALRGSPLYKTSQRFYAGVNLAF